MNIYAIVVTYNGSIWIDKCFGSLVNSSIPVKILAIDNASTDDTPNIIRKKFPEVTVIETGKNLGFGKANNIGFKYALENNADYVFLLNQDAWVMSDTIEKLCTQMQKNQEYGILSPIHLKGDGLKLDLGFSQYITHKNCPDLISDLITPSVKLQPIYKISFVNAAFWLISIECVKKVGVFDTLFPHYGEDNDYINRVLFHSFKTGIIPTCFGFHDRPQVILNSHKKSFKKQYLWMLTRNYILLKNVTKPLNRSLCSFFLSVIMNTIQGIKQLSFFYVTANLYASIIALIHIAQIIKNRQIQTKAFILNHNL